jgi:hypothetical protein
VSADPLIIKIELSPDRGLTWRDITAWFAQPALRAATSWRPPHHETAMTRRLRRLARRRQPSRLTAEAIIRELVNYNDAT